ERAHTPPTDRILRDPQSLSKVDRSRTVDHCRKAFLARVSERLVKEARPHRAVRFENRGDPRRVATRGLGLLHSKMRSKMPDNSSQLFRRLRDEAASAFLFDEGVDLTGQGFNIRDGESNRGLPFHRPCQRTIEGCRSKIRRQK